MAANPLPLPGYIAATIPAKTDHVAGTTLFHLAMVEFGDPMQWVSIAQLNNMTDPWIFDLRDVLIPPVLPGVVRELPEIGGQPFVPPPPPLLFAPNPAFLGLVGAARPLIAFSYVTGGLLLGLTGIAPTVVNSGSPRLIPASAAFALAGSTPTMLHSLSMQPASAAAVLTGQSSQTPFNRQPTVASLALTAATPSRTLSLGVQTVALTLTGVAPTIAVTQNPLFIPSAASLSLSRASPQAPVYVAWSGPTSGLTHRWQFDASTISGATVLDLVGSLNGTLSGGYGSDSSGPGAFAATSTSFDGSTAVMSLSTPPVTPNLAFTVATWVMWPDITYKDGDDMMICNLTDSSRAWIIVNNAIASLGGHLVVGDDVNLNGTGNKFIRTSSAVISSGTWAHVALTFDGTSIATLYVNASSVALVASTTHTGADVGAGGTRIGAGQSGTKFMKGDLYQFVTYNRVLSSAEISALYAAG